MSVDAYTTPPTALDLMRERCNRYANGQCMTRACLRRGGYGGVGPVDYGIATCEYHRAALALAAIDELDGLLDKQLYDDEYVRSMRKNDMDIPPDAEHCVTITHSLWQRINEAAK